MERQYCNGKNMYDKRGAETVRNERMRESHTPLRIYHCDDCGHWHVTHKAARYNGRR